MIIYLLAMLGAALGFGICYVYRETTWSMGQFWGYFRDTIITFTVAATVILIIVRLVSYSSYITIRTQYDAIINQYKGAVVMYTDHATLDVKKAAFTDFKYQGYQENVASLIVTLRGEVVSYNAKLISKRIMKGSVLMKAMIHAPDKDMKIINVVE